MAKSFNRKIKFDKVLIFDLDGTLVDSFMAHAKSFNQTFLNNNLTPISPYEILKIFGLPSEKIVKKLFPKLKKEKIKKISEEKKKRFLKENYKLVKLFPKINLTLKKLRKKYFLILLTNSSSEEIKKIAKVSKLKLNYFDIVLSKEKIKNYKPSIAAVKKIERIIGKDKEKFVVGDSYIDIIFAKKLKAKSIIIINKINRLIIKEIKKYKPDYILKNFEDILKI